MYPDDCGIVKLWPVYFISDCLQAVCFLMLLVFVLIRYSAIILSSISMRLKVYALLITLKAISYVVVFKMIPDLSEKRRVEVCMTCVFVCDQGMRLLFYYMLFKMKVISSIMDYNHRESKQESLPSSQDQIGSQVTSMMAQDLHLQAKVNNLVKRICKFFMFYMINTLICIILRLMLLEDIEDNKPLDSLLPSFIVFQSINTVIEIFLSMYFYWTSVHFFIVLQQPGLMKARLVFGCVALVKFMASIDHLVFMFVKLDESVWENKYCETINNFSSTTYWFYDLNPVITGFLIMLIVRFFAKMQMIDLEQESEAEPENQIAYPPRADSGFGLLVKKISSRKRLSAPMQLNENMLNLQRDQFSHSGDETIQQTHQQNVITLKTIILQSLVDINAQKQNRRSQTEFINR